MAVARTRDIYRTQKTMDDDDEDGDDDDEDKGAQKVGEGRRGTGPTNKADGARRTGRKASGLG